MRSHLFAGAAVCVLAAATFTNVQAAEANDAAAATGASSDASADAAEVEAVVVYGRGEARQVQTIQPKEIASAAPGTSPIKIVEKLPGVNFQSADAFGSYEWSTRITIRGFTQNQLGFTLDGVPLGDMSYGNFNGLHISRAIAGEDLGRVELAQGAGSLATASTSNLGGTLKFFSRDPADTFGVQLAGAAGSNSMFRGFIRLETGELPTGARAYISYADQKTDKWKGQGEQKQQQIDFKIVQPIGEAKLSAFVDWSKRRENDYQDLSLGMISRLGYDWDNITGKWATALAATNVFQANPAGDCTTNVYPSPINCIDDAYYDAAGLRDDTLWGVSFDGPITEALEAHATVYGHTNDGQGLWYTPYTRSPNAGVPGATANNAPIAIRTTEYTIDRKGVVLGGVYTLGGHAIGFGGWYEDNDFDQARRYYGLDLASPRGSLDMLSGPFQTDWAYSFNTKTKHAYLQDVWTINDQLKINFGFKAVNVKITSKTVTGAPVINGSITSKDSFLPQVGATFRVNPDHELFVGYTQNMRAFGAAHTGISPFATTQAGFDAIKNTLEPETSKTVEAGWRLHAGTVQGVAAVYYVKFDNRLIGTTAGAGIVGNPTILANAGAVTSKGFETAATWQITPEWSLFGSYAYNESKYDDDILGPGGVVVQKISGKTTVDTPKHLFKAELAYENNGWFAKIAAHYTGERFFTYTNDKKVPRTTLVDLSAGYRFQGDGWSKDLEIQVNATNVTDKDYVSTIGSNGFGYSGDNQTLLAGAPAQFFVTVRKGF
jgi:iron complex outermembrane receptor protein